MPGTPSPSWNWIQLFWVLPPTALPRGVVTFGDKTEVLIKAPMVWAWGPSTVAWGPAPSIFKLPHLETSLCLPGQSGPAFPRRAIVVSPAVEASLFCNNHTSPVFRLEIHMHRTGRLCRPRVPGELCSANAVPGGWLRVCRNVYTSFHGCALLIFKMKGCVLLSGAPQSPPAPHEFALLNTAEGVFHTDHHICSWTYQDKPAKTCIAFTADDPNLIGRDNYSFQGMGWSHRFLLLSLLFLSWERPGFIAEWFLNQGYTWEPSGDLKNADYDLICWSAACEHTGGV